MKDYYELLNVNQRADKEVITTLYKVLTKRYHPCQNSKESNFKEMTFLLWE